MRLLLDTHVLIWWLAGDLRLGERARALILEPSNEIYVSAASVWEMSIKRALGKLEFANDIEKKVIQAGFSELVIKMSHAELAGQLPEHHNDPFDRMLIAQALTEELKLITSDQMMSHYDVNLIDASK